MSLQVDPRGSSPQGVPPVGLLIGDPAALPSLSERAVGSEPHDSIAAIGALNALAARRTRVAVALTSAMMLAYFGFILLVAFDKPLVGTLIGGGRISIGIVLGALTILLAPVLTAIYVRWTNRHYDAPIAAMRGGRR